MSTRCIPLDTVPLQVKVVSRTPTSQSDISAILDAFIADTNVVCPLPSQIIYQIESFQNALNSPLDTKTKPLKKSDATPEKSMKSDSQKESSKKSSSKRPAKEVEDESSSAKKAKKQKKKE